MGIQEVRFSGSIENFAYLPDLQESVVVHVDENTTAEHIKKKISAKVRVPLDHIHLKVSEGRIKTCVLISPDGSSSRLCDWGPEHETAGPFH